MAEEYTVNFNLVQDAARTAATQGNVITTGGDPNTRKANELNVIKAYSLLLEYKYL